MGLLFGDPHTNAYVTQLGSADNMGKWTIEQIDGRRIFDGLEALGQRIVNTHDKEEAQRAIGWYVKIVRKLEDWPADRMIPSDSGERFTVRMLIRLALVGATNDAYRHPISEDLLARLRPDDEHSQWLGDWESSRSDLDRAREEDREFKEGKSATGNRPSSSATSRSSQNMPK
jgi:hypothetical protein